MKLPVYPRYKPSGVEWLGDVPGHWTVVPFKHRCRRFAIYGANLSSDEYVPDGVRFLRTTDIDDLGQLQPEGVFIEPDQAREYLLRDQDILLSRSGTLGRAFIYSASIHPACAYAGYLVRFVPSEQLNTRFLFHFTKSLPFADWLQTQIIASTIGNVNGQKYAQCPLPLPERKEQDAIAAFLDRETGRVDQLVAKKRDLIDRLKEKRTVLISRTVTRGLRNQDIELLRLRRVLDGIDTGFTPDSYNFPAQEGQAGVLKSGCVNGGVFDPNENKLLAEDVDPPAGLEVKVGDILMSRASGSSELIGSVAQVREQPAAKLYLSDKTSRLRVNKAKCDAAFFAIVMGSNYLRSQLSQIISGAQGLAKNIAQSDMRELLLPSPPLDEQHAIATFLGREKSKIDRMVAKVEEAIERLQEYRTALITAAVTGKIDVRKAAA